MYRNCSILLLLLALLGATTSVSAFCIHNDSEQRLFFEVGDHGINYRKWIAAGSMACCDWRQENCNWTHIATAVTISSPESATTTFLWLALKLSSRR